MWVSVWFIIAHWVQFLYRNTLSPPLFFSLLVVATLGCWLLPSLVGESFFFGALLSDCVGD